VFRRPIRGLSASNRLAAVERFRSAAPGFCRRVAQQRGPTSVTADPTSIRVAPKDFFGAVATARGHLRTSHHHRPPRSPPTPLIQLLKCTTSSRDGAGGRGDLNPPTLCASAPLREPLRFTRVPPVTQHEATQHQPGRRNSWILVRGHGSSGCSFAAARSAVRFAALHAPYSCTPGWPRKMLSGRWQP